MRLAFINSNLRASFVSGSIVHEIQCTKETAAKIVSTWNLGRLETATAEQADASDAIEALITADISTANRRELESKDDARVCVFNRNPMTARRDRASRHPFARR